MNLSNLKPAEGSVRTNKRLGRGQGSGKGGTAARGHNGYMSRSGSGTRSWFEGGQMPLNRRLPKRGFNSPNRVEYAVFNLDRLQGIADELKLSSIDVETIVSNGLANKRDRIKILGRGELKSKLTISSHAASKTAKSAIEAAGGTLNLI